MKLKKPYYWLIIILFTGLELDAQTTSGQKSPPLTKASPSSVGISSERLDRIDIMLKQSLEDNTIPGAVALIARNGKIVFHEAYGNADANGKKLQKDAIFRIASQSKAITSTAVMMLWEEGKFRLDDPISKYIPEFTYPYFRIRIWINRRRRKDENVVPKSWNNRFV